MAEVGNVAERVNLLKIKGKQKISFDFKYVDLFCSKFVGNGSNKGFVYPTIRVLKKKAPSRSVYMI